MFALEATLNLLLCRQFETLELVPTHDLDVLFPGRETGLCRKLDLLLHQHVMERLHES